MPYIRVVLSVYSVCPFRHTAGMWTLSRAPIRDLQGFKRGKTTHYTLFSHLM